MSTRAALIRLAIVVSGLVISLLMGMRLAAVRHTFLIDGSLPNSPLVTFEGMLFNVSEQTGRAKLAGVIQYLAMSNRDAVPRFQCDPTSHSTIVLDVLNSVTDAGISALECIDAKTHRMTPIYALGAKQVDAFHSAGSPEVFKVSPPYPDKPWIDPASKRSYAWLRLRRDGAEGLHKSVPYVEFPEFAKLFGKHYVTIMVAEDVTVGQLIWATGEVKRVSGRDALVIWE